MKAKDKTRTATSGMKFVRGIATYTCMDHRRNEDTLKET
jgi:hypothetical protein